MRYTFRDKLLLSFAAVLVVTVVPVLVLVNTQIETISSREIAQSLENTRGVFRRFQTTQLQSNSERASTFILTQPEIRAEIVTAGLGSDGLLGDSLGAPPAAPTAGEAPTQEEDPFGAQPAPQAAPAREDGPFGARPVTPQATAKAKVGSKAAAALRAGGDEEEDPFGAQPVTAAPAASKPAPQAGARRQAPPPAQPARREQEVAERTARILSIVQEVSFYNASDVFFLADFRGRLVFNKVQPRLTGMDLSRLPGLLGALQGNEIFTWWGSQEEALKGLELLPPAEAPVLYQMFLKPVVFGGEVKGVLGTGLAVTRSALEEITGITQSELAFISKGVVYLNSLAAMPAATLLTVAGRAPAQGGRIESFLALGEEFLALPVPVTSSLGERVGQVLVYRSKTREQQVFDNLKQILNLIGILALLFAGLLAVFISHSVSGAVRQLFQAVNEVRKGNLDYRVAVSSRDEFGNLERAFNEMTAGLREKEAIRDTFKRYVSSSVVDELLRNLGNIKLGGENKPLTIQFSDIAGFTSLSESMTPEQVVEFLNEYLSAMTEEVERYQGIVDKYIGDAVMAFWGTPVVLENHALSACRAVLGQVRRIDELRARWAARGNLARFNVRVGLHTGRVIVGNIGSTTRMDYTIIGDSVNTASRLEGMNKVYGTRVILSEDTCRMVEGHMIVRELDWIRPVGKTEPVRIYELVGEAGEINGAATAHFAAFAEALALYRARDFRRALAAFTDIARATGDGPSRALAQRCQDYLNDPPGPDWDGVFAPKEK